MSQKVIRIRDVLLIRIPHKESSIHGTLQKVHKIENYFKARNKAYLTLYAKFPLKDYLRINGQELVRIPVYFLRINLDTLIWGAPLELFCEIAMNIRANSSYKNTFYFGLTNGTLLYLPTKKAFAEGGYEPSVSPFTENAEEDFTETVTSYIRDTSSNII